MKNLIKSIVLVIVVMMTSCTSSSNNTNKNVAKEQDECYASKDKEYAKPNAKGGFGEIITKEGATPIVEFCKTYDKKIAQHIKLSGKVTGVCENKGCWMTLDNGTADGLTVHFKDYAFFVPRDIKGKNAIIEGEIKTDTTSVKELQHYAKDAGKSEEEINKITNPKVELTFLANGVIIEK
jgi:Domain of unknown function (DUF4920)